MAVLLSIVLVVVLILYGRSISIQLSKSIKEAGIYLLVLLAVIAIAALAFSIQ